MNNNEITLFFAEIGNSAPCIDLHGLFVDDAINGLEKFITNEFAKGTEVVKIIHGHGTGRLRQIVHDWLSQSKYVIGFRIAYTGAITLAILGDRK